MLAARPAATLSMNPGFGGVQPFDAGDAKVGRGGFLAYPFALMMMPDSWLCVYDMGRQPSLYIRWAAGRASAAGSL
jgi:hypothetical protein